MQNDPEVAAGELDRQLRLMQHELPERLVLASLVFGLCLIWVSPLIIVLLWSVYLLVVVVLVACCSAGSRPPGSMRYGMTLTGMALASALYAGAAGLVWQVDSSFSKAFAVIVIMAGLMHLSTVRSIHLPIGIAGLAGMSGAALVANALYWLRVGDFTALGISTAACFAVFAYGLTALLSNHHLHRSMMAGERTAQAAEEAKGLFLSRLSHELRTPLNSVLGMSLTELAVAQSAADSDETVARRQRMQALSAAARALALLLDDVSDLDAITHGRLKLRPRIVPIGAELRAIATIHAARAERLAIPLTVYIPDDLPEFVRLDPLRLRQCLGNLLTNALLHAPQGEISMTCLCLSATDTDTPTVLQIDVRDNGPGIPASQRDAIFEAFRQGRNDSKGSGLGLAIARELARSMGGNLTLLETEPGATFRLVLPVATSSPPVSPAAQLSLAGRSILVVDDVATNRMVATAYLRALGATVITAESGEEALNILASEEVALVLLDMNMPGLDGFATTARIREMGRKAAALPVVAMTADVLEDQVATIRRGGLDGYLPKPLLPEVLEAELIRLLG